jgi:hypothetical protein
MQRNWSRHRIGMAIYSKYGAVANQDGSNLLVHDALILIKLRMNTQQIKILND